jgi:hypothetical protein
MGGAVEDWATESLLAARQAYQDPATGQRIKPGTKLADSYQDANLPVVRRRLYQAGARLATVPNGVPGEVDLAATEGYKPTAFCDHQFRVRIQRIKRHQLP